MLQNCFIQISLHSSGQTLALYILLGEEGEGEGGGVKEPESVFIQCENVINFRYCLCLMLCMDHLRTWNKPNRSHYITVAITINL